MKNDLHKQAIEEHTNLLHNILPKHVAEHYLGDNKVGSGPRGGGGGHLPRV